MPKETAIGFWQCEGNYLINQWFIIKRANRRFDPIHNIHTIVIIHQNQQRTGKLY